MSSLALPYFHGFLADTVYCVKHASGDEHLPEPMMIDTDIPSVLNGHLHRVHFYYRRIVGFRQSVNNPHTCAKTHISKFEKKNYKTILL